MKEKKDFLGRSWLHWFHYVLLTGVLFLAFFSASWLGIVNQTMQLSLTIWVFLFIWYFLFIAIGDTLIHKLLGVD